MAGSGRVVLRLFVAGKTLPSQRAVETLRNIVADPPDGGEGIQLEVIDILEQPKRAEEARSIATPTLIVGTGAPARRLVGDLSDRQAVLDAVALGRPRIEEDP